MKNININMLADGTLVMFQTGGEDMQIVGFQVQTCRAMRDDLIRQLTAANEAEERAQAERRHFG